MSTFRGYFRNAVFVIFVLLDLIVLPGCGRNGLLPATGTVRYADGSPIEFETGAVIFIAPESGASAQGAVEPDGSFTMMSKVPGDGIAPGSYKVVLNLWKSYRNQTSAVPDLYADVATTPLEATVDSDHTHFDFVVEP